MRACNALHKKRIISLCAGWFWELNEGFVLVINDLVRHLVTGDLDIMISPLGKVDCKGSALTII